MKQKEIFMQYILNNRDQLQEDVRRLQQQVRYRRVDQVDCLELALAIERLNAFEDFSRAATEILNLSTPEPMTYVSIDTEKMKGVNKDENRSKRNGG